MITEGLMASLSILLCASLLLLFLCSPRRWFTVTYIVVGYLPDMFTPVRVRALRPRAPKVIVM